LRVRSGPAVRASLVDAYVNVNCLKYSLKSWPADALDKPCSVVYAGSQTPNAQYLQKCERIHPFARDTRQIDRLIDILIPNLGL
jgi:hypothetical protein